MKTTAFLILFFFLFLNALYAQKLQDTTYYSVVINGFIIGEHLCWKNNDSTYNYIYNYSERGRGDSLITELTVDNNFIIKQVTCVGTDYYHQPYQQNVYIKNDSLISDVNGFSEYVSNASSQYYLQNIPASRELLYRSVLNRADKKILVGHNDSLYLSSITSHKNGR